MWPLPRVSRPRTVPGVLFDADCLSEESLPAARISLILNGAVRLDNPWQGTGDLQSNCETASEFDFPSTTLSTTSTTRSFSSSQTTACQSSARPLWTSDSNSSSLSQPWTTETSSSSEWRTTSTSSTYAQSSSCTGISTTSSSPYTSSTTSSSTGQTSSESTSLSTTQCSIESTSTSSRYSTSYSVAGEGQSWSTSSLASTTTWYSEPCTPSWHLSTSSSSSTRSQVSSAQSSSSTLCSESSWRAERSKSQVSTSCTTTSSSSTTSSYSWPSATTSYQSSYNTSMEAMFQTSTSSPYFADEFSRRLPAYTSAIPPSLPAYVPPLEAYSYGSVPPAYEFPGHPNSVEPWSSTSSTQGSSARPAAYTLNQQDASRFAQVAKMTVRPGNPGGVPAGTTSAAALPQGTGSGTKADNFSEPVGDIALRPVSATLVPVVDGQTVKVEASSTEKQSMIISSSQAQTFVQHSSLASGSNGHGLALDVSSSAQLSEWLPTEMAMAEVSTGASCTTRRASVRIFMMIVLTATGLNIVTV